MRLTIKRENYKQLVQCIFLGEMVINEYFNKDEYIKEYSDFVENILKQVIKKVPNIESKLHLSALPYERTEDLLLSDLSDRIFDSITPYYEKYRKSVFCEILAEKIANKNYPIIEHDFADDCSDNVLAKNLYFKLLLIEDNCDFVTIFASKIDRQIERAKKKLNT